MGWTRFPHGISSMGVPQLGGGIPLTSGTYFFVNFDTGNDGNEGTSMDAPLLTVAAAYAKMTTNKYDVCLISGSAQSTFTSMLEITKNRCIFIGLDGAGRRYGQRTRVTMGTTGVAGDIATVQNTGVGNVFKNIKFSNSSATATCLYTFAEGGEYTYFENCEFYKSSLLTTDNTAEVLCNGDSSQWVNCTFGDLVNERGASTVERPNVLLTREQITGKVARDCEFIDCLFLHKAAHVDACFFYGANATDVERRLLIVRPVFWNCTLATAAVADAVDFGAAQTTGDVLIIDPAAIKTTALGGASLNVFVQGAVPTAATTGIAVEVAA